MGGTKACHLLHDAPPADLICMCMARRTMAELRACQLQQSAQSAYCLARRCLCSHATPSAAACRWGSGMAGDTDGEGVTGGGGGRVQCQRGHLSWIWPVLTSCGERDGVRLRIIFGQLPSNYYLLTHTWKTLVNRLRRRDRLCLGAAAAATTCSWSNNEVCMTHQPFSPLYLVLHAQERLTGSFIAGIAQYSSVQSTAQTCTNIFSIKVFKNWMYYLASKHLSNDKI